MKAQKNAGIFDILAILDKSPAFEGLVNPDITIPAAEVIPSIKAIRLIKRKKIEATIECAYQFAININRIKVISQKIP